MAIPCCSFNCCRIKERVGKERREEDCMMGQNPTIIVGGHPVEVTQAEYDVCMLAVGTRVNYRRKKADGSIQEGVGVLGWRGG